MVFDGDCDFCKRWIERWRQITGDKVDYSPFQELSGRWPELPRSRYEQAVQLLSPDGSVDSGAAAVFRSLATNRRYGWLLRLYERLPGFAAAADIAYAFVARHRMFSSRITRLLWGKHVARPQLFLVRALFLKLLALCYFCAFVSLWTQIDGLIGESGILPAQQTVESWRTYYASSALPFFKEPSLCWLSASNKSLHLQCALGATMCVLVLTGAFPRLALLTLWLLYLSLTQVSGVFLGYQWDNLLLETGFLSIFLAPAGFFPHRMPTAVPSAVVWLLRWLLFRLMFASGCVKLLSGDSTWRQLTALQYHYETQPLPTWVAWYAHHLPASFHKWSALGMFGIELGVPFLIFLPRRPRMLACALFIALELGIALTGNYTFFNFLTIALCVLLLDDAAVRALVPTRWRSLLEPPKTCPLSVGFRSLIAVVGVIVLLVTSMQLLAMFRSGTNFWPPLVHVYQAVAPFRSINNYGLFAVMTTNRPEIMIEGSTDAKEWASYQFRHKPDKLEERPRFVAPHQPRLDWQMWFAALGTYRHNPWFLAFCQRLLEGSPDVLELLESAPFSNAPPTYIRAVVYDYKFTTSAEREESGQWWKREPKGLYIPVLTLEGEGTNRHLAIPRPPLHPQP
jgi:predicted DCC family thiol-disulfide oxidoreductase YuxK